MAPKKKMIEVTTDEPIVLHPVSHSLQLITLVHTERDETVEITPTQWEHNRAHWEQAGWRHPDEERTLLTPPGETWQHSTGTGFVRDEN